MSKQNTAQPFSPIQPPTLKGTDVQSPDSDSPIAALGLKVESAARAVKAKKAEYDQVSKTQSVVAEELKNARAALALAEQGLQAALAHAKR
jgi:hypothetical protein